MSATISPTFQPYKDQPYQDIKNMIKSDKQSYYVYNKAYAQNDTVLKLTNTIEADISQIKYNQYFLANQLNQIQARLDIRG